MNQDNVFVALDIGTSKICTVVVVFNPEENRFEIASIGNHVSLGIRKGSIVNIDQTATSIATSIEEARFKTGLDISKVIVGVGGVHVQSFDSSGMIAIENQEVTTSDLDSVLNTARAIHMSSDRVIVHAIPQKYKIDNIDNIKNPVGMCGKRLEAVVHIVTGSQSLLHNLNKCITQIGLEIEGFCLQSLASSDAVLSAEEKEMGIILVDIGGGTSDIAVWKDGSLIDTCVIPIGGSHFTNDLSVALKTSFTKAEDIKIKHGSVLKGGIANEEKIIVPGLSGTKDREYPLSFVSSVLSDRAEELFEIMRERIIARSSLATEIKGGVVFTGGGALLRGFCELGEFTLELPTKLGYPMPVSGIVSDTLREPQYATILGLLASKIKNFNLNVSSIKGDFLSKINNSFRSIKDIF